MKDAVTYIVETLICSGIFVLLYRLLFGAKISYGLSRSYLLESTLVAAVIPLLAIPVYPARVIEISLPMASAATDGIVAGGASEALNLDLSRWAMAIYFVGVALFLALMIAQALRIGALRRGAEQTRQQGTRICTSPRIFSPFSFFGTIYLSEGLSADEREAIVAHERSHIAHRHSAEKVFMGLLRAVLWFNPFVWISYRDLVEVHEYEADRDMLDAGYELTRYRSLILKQLLGYNPEITSGFANSLTKKRFIMMTKKKCRHELLRYTAVAPAVVAMFLLFGFTRIEPADGTIAETVETPAVQTDEKPLLNADVMPRFQGGDLNTFRQWIADNIEAPKSSVAKRVNVEFVVECDGTVDDINFLQAADANLKQAVAEVLRKSPKWEPGRQDGKAVRVKFLLPIIFAASTPAK